MIQHFIDVEIHCDTDRHFDEPDVIDPDDDKGGAS